MNTNMVAVNVIGRVLFGRWIELESDTLLKFTQELVGRPAVPQKQKLQPGAFPVFAQNLGIAEQFRNAPDHW
jgi:hypothetical protein